MTRLAPTLESFFTDRLTGQRQASAATIRAYRDTFRLLLSFAHRQIAKQPSALDLGDLDAPLIGAFLHHLEQQRGNTARTRNARLSAIHSFFRFAALQHPEHADLIARVLDIPPKRFDRASICYLTDEEVTALLLAPDRGTWTGRRDHALLALAIQTGLRVSELTSLNCAAVALDRGKYVRCMGKGRKERATPLGSQCAPILREWLDERHGTATDPLFPTRRGTALSTDAVAWLLSKHADAAAERCPTLGSKRVTPHVLRHTAAMRLRQAGVDISVIALWLGHESIESTQMYLHADLKLKEDALDRTAPLGTTPGRYRPSDDLLAFLESL